MVYQNTVHTVILTVLYCSTICATFSKYSTMSPTNYKVVDNLVIGKVVTTLPSLKRANLITTKNWYMWQGLLCQICVLRSYTVEFNQTPDFQVVATLSQPCTQVVTRWQQPGSSINRSPIKWNPLYVYNVPF